jgi:hypothetical protein
MATTVAAYGSAEASDAVATWWLSDGVPGDSAETREPALR